MKNVDSIVNESILDMYLDNQILLTESSTIDALKIYFSDEKKELKECIHNGRKCIKNRDYKKAIVYMNQAKTICKNLKGKLDKLDDDAFESVLSNLIYGLIVGITQGLAVIIVGVERIIMTRSLRAGAVSALGTERDYTEDIFQRIFKNGAKREVIATINFLSASIDKTIVSLKKLDMEEKALTKIK